MNLRAWLREAPFGLTMSSGFFGFFAHAGMLTALEGEGLVPARVSGSSAGALVGGAWAAGLPARAIGEAFVALRRESFWDPRFGPGLLGGALFRALLDELLPVKTFEACRVPVAVSVFDVLSGRVRVLRKGPLAPALQASCSVPFLFHPVWMGGRPYVDGGVTDRPGLEGMPPTERVLYHHLGSRSPWRGSWWGKGQGGSLEVPLRPNLTTLVLDDLPRVGPFRLAEGVRAFESARARTEDALLREVAGGTVRG